MFLYCQNYHFWTSLIFRNLSNERDVEITLLEPLLKRLGFDENDWLRQMTLRMGRNDRVFPDYALFANDRRGEESARFIWEAKYRIANERQLKDAFLQAKVLCFTFRV